jgi:hypothetical protein
MSYLNSIQCQKNGYYHSSRLRTTEGFHCEDCGEFVKKGTLQYFMTEGHTSIWMAIHNKSADFRRGESKSDISDQLKTLLVTLFDSTLLNSLTEVQAIQLREDTYRILESEGIQDNEATVVIK